MLRENGQQVMNTALPSDAPLPARRDATTLRQLFATAKPSVSDVFYSVVVPRPVVALEAPVLRPDGSVAYSLTLNPTLDAFDDLLRRQQLGEKWIVAIWISRLPLLHAYQAARDLSAKRHRQAFCR